MFTAEEFNSYIWQQEKYFLESFLAWTALGPRLIWVDISENSNPRGIWLVLACSCDNCAPDMPSHVNIDEVYHALIASFP